MKLQTLIRDYLSFNQTELRGIFVLLFILVSLILSHALIPSETWNKPIDFSSFEKETRAFENAWQKAKEDEFIEKKEKSTRRGQYPSFPQKDSARLNHQVPPLTFTIELNTADTFDLQRLKGIGPSFARRIIAYRERLGGFIRKAQLLEVWGMDTVRYRLIEKNIRVVPDSVRKIDLNQVTFKELIRHPYFPFELTKSIMLYRQKIKKISTVEELRNIQAVSDSVFRLIIPYIWVGF